MLQRNFDQPYPAAPEPVPTAVAGWQAPTVDLREMARILRRRWRAVVLPAAVLGGIALAYVATATTLYTANSTVLVDPRRANVVETNQSVLTNFGTDDATIESQTLLIQSLTILQRVVDKLKLTQDLEFMPKPGLLDPIRNLFRSSSPVDGVSPEDAARAYSIYLLQRRMKVTRQGTTFLVDIAVSSESPQKAATIANAVADAYFEEQVRAKFDATRIAAKWLGGQIDALKNRVVTSEQAVADYRSANNLAVSQGVTVNDQQITDLNSKLIAARVQTAEARAKFDQVQQLAKTGGDAGGLNAAVSSEMVTKLRAQYADIAKNEADLTSKYGPRHPQVANVRAQLKDTQRLINEEIGRIVQGTAHDYDVAKSREASLQDSFDKLQGVSSTSGQAVVRLHELQREAEANRTLYESYLARSKETTAQESLEMPDSRIVSFASIPLKPSAPKTMLILGFAILLGLGGGTVLAFLTDYLDGRIKTLEQAEEISGVPALAALPSISSRELAGRAKRGRTELGNYDPRTMRLLPAALQPPLMRYAIEEPGTFFAEAIRAVRLAIQRARKIDTVKVVLVTSGLESEGKTTFAGNLALSFATLGIKTLLIDGDLRNPGLTRAVSPNADAGLLQVATGEVSLERAILLDRSTGLSILPSPAIKDVDAITELMFSEQIVEILDRLKSHYELIIIDSPPLIPLVDGRALAELADRILLAMAWNQTPREVVAHTMELLAPVHDRILGTVLTQVDLSKIRFYDYYRSSAYLKPYGVAAASAGAAR
ncbi:GumC family protein [Tardiphaga sp. 1201_B9_N1_1]|jgi:exopolysaccharide transport family protein|uniref:non-specific protein-tyrosine kinase n=1 Tax=Tardiphaga robiniae TaxID=943830 RepID=A0A7G6TT19_9BRAD|nr:polysaccharide biosynthesis tyrosine autokinase [Tardiphaga robiniae]MDR6661744.1 exopolysaccharide transport family protein [Tardiphaga robiniae]NUU41470.1 polysaccharide biosynthesis tyrosine autokinase [Tardiphaga robiniae]QND69901.1 polysaccharide biosynthesis tyrosine autokinase [Tardiphaga robiniae]